MSINFANDIGCNIIYCVWNIREINDLNLGVKIGNKKVSILLYADDIVLLSDT